MKPTIASALHRPLLAALLAVAAISGARAAGPLPLHLVAGAVEAGFRDGSGAAARFREPIRLAAFDDDSILVADIFNHAIRRVTRDGTVTTIAGRPEPGHRDGPAGQALFDSPHGVSVSATGVIAVGEATNNTVRLITPVKDGTAKRAGYEVTTLAGTPGVSGMRDGPAAQALFASPHAVAWQPDGSLLVLDIGNAPASGLTRSDTSAERGIRLSHQGSGRRRRPDCVRVELEGRADDRSHLRLWLLATTVATKARRWGFVGFFVMSS